MTSVLLLLVALALALMCAVFVAAEFALTTVDRYALERAAEADERGARGARTAVRRLTFQLSGAQLGITVTGLVIGMLANPSLAALLRGPLTASGISDGAVSSLSMALGVALSTVVVMVLGELVPKNWAISRPLGVAKVVAAPQRAFTAAFGPLIRHLNSAANRMVRGVGLEPAEELSSARGPSELVALARHSARRGAIEPGAAELFVRTLHLGGLTAENVMTPRVNVMALESAATALDVSNLTRATGLSQFPVYRESLDEVVGVVHVRDALAIPPESRRAAPVTQLVTAPLLVPETLTVDQLLGRLRTTRTLAVVVDEYGGTAGIATLEDIVEEVVGEVRDEHDPEETPELVPETRTDWPAARAHGAGVWHAEGSVRIDQLRAIGLSPPQGPYETVAGLVAHLLARIPEPGDRVSTEGWRLEVVDVARHRARRLRIAAPLADDPGRTPERTGSVRAGTDVRVQLPGPAGPFGAGAAPRQREGAL